MKRVTKEGWRALKVYNSHDLCKAGGKGVYVDYISADYGRAGHGASWRVIKLGSKTDPDGPWYNHGNKTFIVHGREDKQEKFLEAILWASERYNIKGEWERDPWGSYHPEGTLEAALIKQRDMLADLVKEER